jgi:diguanylate cyclase (GGDEF)-like protein
MLGVDHNTTAELLTLAVGEGFTGWVAEHGEALLINDTLADPRGKTIDGTDEVPESMLVVPMVYESRTLGVIVLSQLGVDRFSDDDLQTMGIFAGYAAQAMANATTYEQLTEQTAELARRAESQRRLLEVNQRLMWTLDQRDVLDTIADGLGEVVPYDAVSIHRVDRETGATHAVLSRASGERAGPSTAPADHGLIAWAVSHHEAVLANDVRSDPRADAASYETPGGMAAIVVPLIADGEVLGALSLQRDAGPRAEFSEADFQLVQLFAAQASIAVRNADTHHAMSERAETDALTGLRNHGAFQRDLAIAVDRAAESSGAPLSVLMMDLDRFKAYNDHHGHPAGDDLLRRVAASLNDAARAGDGVYRYGGDEFVLILMAASPGDAVRVAERLRGAVAALTAADATPVTITVGIAGLPGDAQDRAGLISAADAALYFGKRSGADRVVRADELPRRRRTDATDATSDRDASLDAA